MKTNDMVCTSCGQPKAELHAKTSRLIAKMPLYLCNECITLKREPRAVIILYGRDQGWEAIADYIKNERYVGAPITAKELL